MNNAENILFGFAESIGLIVKFKPLQYNDGRLKGNRIALGEHLKGDKDKVNFILAHELAHYYLHSDKGDTINSTDHESYEEQADRSAALLCSFIRYCESN